MSVFIDMDRMVGKGFEAGLVDLKALTEKQEGRDDSPSRDQATPTHRVADLAGVQRAAQPSSSGCGPIRSTWRSGGVRKGSPIRSARLDARPGGAIRITCALPMAPFSDDRLASARSLNPSDSLSRRLRRTTRGKPLLRGSHDRYVCRAVGGKTKVTVHAECGRSCSRGAADARGDGSWLDAKPRKARRICGAGTGSAALTNWQ